MFDFEPYKEEYNGYELNDGVFKYDLSENQIMLLDTCIWLYDNKATIRDTAENCCYCKSTLHNLIHTELPDISYELYKCVVRVLKQNKNKYFK